MCQQRQLDYFTQRVMNHTFVHEDLKQMMKSYRYDSHPMGMLIGYREHQCTCYV